MQSARATRSGGARGLPEGPGPLQQANRRRDAEERRLFPRCDCAGSRHGSSLRRFCGCLLHVGIRGYSVLKPGEAMPKAKEAALKALSLDDRWLKRTQRSAFITSNYDWNRSDSEKLLKRAIELNPNYARAHQKYAWNLAALGQHDDARREIEKARDLDPLSLIISTITSDGWRGTRGSSTEPWRPIGKRWIWTPPSRTRITQLGQALTSQRPVRGRHRCALEKAADLGGRPAGPLLAHWATHGLCPAIGREHTRCSPSCSSELNRVMCPGIG